MTVRIERSGTVPADIERVWEFIADPATRAKHISVVEDWDVDEDGTATWTVAVPLPFVDRTVELETRDLERDPPTYVKFEGRASVATVQGEHELEAVADGTRVTNRFVVEGRMPGVESFFERNLDRELENLQNALRDAIEAGELEE